MPEVDLAELQTSQPEDSAVEESGRMRTQSGDIVEENGGGAMLMESSGVEIDNDGAVAKKSAMGVGNPPVVMKSHAGKAMSNGSLIMGDADVAKENTGMILEKTGG